MRESIEHATRTAGVRTNVAATKNVIGRLGVLGATINAGFSVAQAGVSQRAQRTDDAAVAALSRRKERIFV